MDQAVGWEWAEVIHGGRTPAALNPTRNTGNNAPSQRCQNQTMQETSLVLSIMTPSSKIS